MKLEIVYWPIGRLRPDPGNPNKHPDAQVDEIVAGIEEHGGLYGNPILVSADGMIRAGEGRWLAAKKAQLTEVPVIVLPAMSDAGYRRLSLRDNRIPQNSILDDALLREALIAIQAEGAAVNDLGFDDREIAKALEKERPLKIETVPVGPINDRFWISIRGPLASQASALAQLRAVMADIPGVEVELGTIAVET